jgi:hypothetical protein
MVVPTVRLEPAAGLMIVELGGVVSVDALARIKPDCRVAGWMPMSAKRFNVACCMFGSEFGGVPNGSS